MVILNIAKIFALGIFIISLVCRKEGLGCFTMPSLFIFALLHSLF